MNSYKLSNTKLNGVVHPPSSKSIAHRYIMCSALTNGISTIENIVYCDDIMATLSCVEQLGCDVTYDEDKVTIRGIFSNQNSILNSTNKNISEAITFSCNESGSTLRFIIPITLLIDSDKKFVGNKSLFSRPLDEYYSIFDKNDIHYTSFEDSLIINGNNKLTTRTFSINGDVSSQFVTGLMFMLPLLCEKSTINIVGDLQSKKYVDLTIEAMKLFGITIINNDYKQFVIQGNQTYTPQKCYVEADFSAASNFIVANEIGNTIDIKGLNLNSLQSDRAIIDIVKEVNSNKDYVEIDASQCPDIMPIVSILLALKTKRSKIINAKRLKIKECDRLFAIHDTLKNFGVETILYDDSIEILGVDVLKVCDTFSTFSDHRIAMMIAIAGTNAVGDIFIDNYKCVNKSYPKFFEDYTSLGGKLYE